MCSPKYSLYINGELTGFFGSSRGLTQGDPISSYLFVIIMEAFSGLVHYRVDIAQDFVYHWRCSKTKLTHISFADDIMLFCGKFLRSARVLNGALMDFSSWSGLCPNYNKSNIFIAGSDLKFNKAFRREFNFQLGNLPVKYLGLTLFTSRLTAGDCKPLIDTMLARIRNGL